MTWIWNRKNIAMLLCQLINKCCSWAKRFSSVLCSNFSSTSFLSLFLFVSYFVFFYANLFSCFLCSPLDPTNFRVLSVHFRGFCFFFCQLILLFQAYTQGLQSKMCLRDPYLKITFSAHLHSYLHIPLQIFKPTAYTALLLDAWRLVALQYSNRVL